MKFFKSNKIRRDTKRVFLKKGTCSRTFFYILNREFGHPKEEEEHAADPLAGGILQQGYQCGMLWGASLAVGAECFRRFGNGGQAVGMAIKATQHVMESFVKRTNSADCADITSCDFSSKFSIAKYFFSGKFLSCFKLAEKWAPEAIQAAAEGLSLDQSDLPRQPLSCASELAKKMGATDEEMVMVAGFAGGLGLSGNACGALGAAIWMNTLTRIRRQNYKTSFSDRIAGKILNALYETTNYEILCSDICGRCFKTIDEHSEFIKNGGCSDLIDTLVKAGTIE